MTTEDRNLTEPPPAPTEEPADAEGSGKGLPGPADTPRRATVRVVAVAVVGVLAVGSLAYLRVLSPLDAISVLGGLVLLLLLPRFERQRDGAKLERDALLSQLLRETRENRRVVAELAGAVGEYGRHLRSHTEVLRAMSAASGDLVATVVALRAVVPGAAADPEVAEAAAATVPGAPRALLDPRALGPRPGDIPPPLLNWRGR